jgi:metal-responsive CopG/Arc/MetJ family transcriptional regulator
MAKTPSSSKSESVTLRIPNEVFSSVLNYATDKTKGNRSEAIVELIELGLAVASSQQPTQTGITVQDTALQSQLIETRETVTALAEQVGQLTGVVQDTVLQRLTKLETEMMGEPSA